MPTPVDSVLAEPLFIGVLTNSNELVDPDYSIDLETMNISYNQLKTLFYANASRHFNVSRTTGFNEYLNFANKKQVDSDGVLMPFNLLDFVVQKMAEKRGIPASALSSNSIIASTKAALKYKSLVQFEGCLKALTLYEVKDMLISNNTIVPSQNSIDEASVCLVLKALYQDIPSNLTVGVNFRYAVKIPGYVNLNSEDPMAKVAGPKNAKSEGKEKDDDNNMGGNEEEKPNGDKKKVKEEAEIPMKVAKKMTEEDMNKENVFFKQEEEEDNDDDDDEDEYFENPKKPHYSRDEKNYYDKSTPEKEPSVRFFNLKEKNNNESDKLVNSILHQIMSLNDEDNEENDDEMMDFQNDEDTIAGWSNN
uniref:Uncharacterized protein n=1 Tax=viral metagenome TaxID=1070528 RepID=A0A6C0B9Y0_9ZZZZ